MKWVTRKNAAVDRIACPWLIRRFIDSEAEFLYVDEADVFRIAREQGAEPYDVEGAEMGHVDGRCSFESIILRYGLQDAGLSRLADIVHGADVEADISKMPESAGLYADRDLEKLEAEMPLYDALYAWCAAQ